MSEQTLLSSVEVARLFGVKYMTFWRWLQRGVIPAPPARFGSSDRFLMWTEDDIARVRAILKRKRPKLRFPRAASVK
jgi:hypothetical protein